MCIKMYQVCFCCINLSLCQHNTWCCQKSYIFCCQLLPPRESDLFELQFPFPFKPIFGECQKNSMTANLACRGHGLGLNKKSDRWSPGVFDRQHRHLDVSSAMFFSKAQGLSRRRLSSRRGAGFFRRPTLPWFALDHFETSISNESGAEKSVCRWSLIFRICSLILCHSSFDCHCVALMRAPRVKVDISLVQMCIYKCMRIHTYITLHYITIIRLIALDYMTVP